MIKYNNRTADKAHAPSLLGRPMCLVAALLLASFASLQGAQSAHALSLSDRSLRIGEATPGLTTSHDFSFSYGSTTTAIGSLLFEYCTSPLPQLACVTPTGMDATGATLAGQTGDTGYAILGAAANQIMLTRVPVAPAASPSSYTFSNIVNPNVTGTFYVRISTYNSVDGSGAQVDFAAVVNTTTQGVQISTEVPPILKFCVGLRLGDDCTAADDSVIDLGELKPANPASGTSQMIAATNAEFGLAIAVYGTTMTSGNNVIPALDTPTVSAPGNAQFGFNLRDNADPNVGRDPEGAGSIAPAVGYNTPNRYAFTAGSTVATSPAATDTRKLTASYIANIPPDQAPGVYTATMTYICTATF